MRRRRPGRRVDHQGLTAPKEYRADIDGLRAVAIVLVVLYHAGIARFAGGYVGVDVFFVISGFLITGLLVDERLATGRTSLRSFYARRIRRLLPLSALVLVATAIAAAALLPPLDRGTAAADIGASAGYVANIRYAAAATDYQAADVNSSPTLHYWSLGVEEQFYIVWPLLIICVLGGRRRRSARVTTRRLALALAVVGLASFALCAWMTRASQPWAYFSLPTRAWELAVGGLLALARPALRRMRGASALAVAGGVAVIAAATTFGPNTAFPGTAAALPVIGTAAIVAAGARANTATRALGSGWLAYVGRVSYGWYLWHWPCLFVAHIAAPAGADGAGTHGGAIAAAVAASFGLAVVSHHVVEQPVRRAATFVRSLRLTFATGVTLTAISLSSAAVLAASGGGVAAASALPPPAHTAAGAPVRAASPAAVGLTMTPAQARNDKPDIGPCTAPPTSSVAVPGCVFGDPHGARAIVLLGDSHALQWFPALDAMAAAHRWRLYAWTKSACPFTAARIWRLRLHREFFECEGWHDSVLQRLHELGHVDAVLLARVEQTIDYVVNDAGGIASHVQARTLWRRGMSRTFAELGEVASRVVVMRDVPRPEIDIPACLSAEAPAACEFARAGHVHLDGSLFNAERAVATPSVTFFDPTDLICPEGPTCPVVDARGVIMYRDDDHLTARYDRSLWRPAVAALAPLLGFS